MYQYRPNGCAGGCFCVEPQHFDPDGFDLDDIPSDRFGVRESILGRVRRRGGTATVTCKESGTEVHLVVPVGPCPPGAEALPDEVATAVSEPQEKERTS